MELLRDLVSWPDFSALRQNAAPIISSLILFGLVGGTFIAILIATAKP